MVKLIREKKLLVKYEPTPSILGAVLGDACMLKRKVDTGKNQFDSQIQTLSSIPTVNYGVLNPKSLLTLISIEYYFE
uniref:Uncharacterized protein n=1 Tax=Romanomermis culicivorax TaxID=13658 RepID=A0A915HXX8_ROMCU